MLERPIDSFAEWLESEVERVHAGLRSAMKHNCHVEYHSGLHEGLCRAKERLRSFMAGSVIPPSHSVAEGVLRAASRQTEEESGC